MENEIRTLWINVTKFVSYCEAVLTMLEPNINKGYLEAKNKIISEFRSKVDNANDEILQDDEVDQEDDYFTKKEYDKAFQMYDKVSIRIQNKMEKFEKPPVQLGAVTLPENMVLNAN